MPAQLYQMIHIERALIEKLICAHSWEIQLRTSCRITARLAGYPCCAVGTLGILLYEREYPLRALRCKKSDLKLVRPQSPSDNLVTLPAV
jgi:hypothetical protein